MVMILISIYGINIKMEKQKFFFMIRFLYYVEKLKVYIQVYYVIVVSNRGLVGLGYFVFMIKYVGLKINKFSDEIMIFFFGGLFINFSSRKRIM